ncbi:hypothetical protein K502DRAFT_349622 [Neoconidiobolus thromboides FSU 785]|nr:hypothetical protein K502DRAFT_349622 [Neoconidiobolus thromboides FSU 785]
METNGLKKKLLSFQSFGIFYYCDHVAKSFNKSLDELRFNYVGLYLIHWPYSQADGEGLLLKNPDGILKTQEGLPNFDIDGTKQILAKAKIRPAVL